MRDDRRTFRHRVNYALLTIAVAAGCAATPKPEDQARLGVTYADILVAQQQAGTDTLTFKKRADSIARAHQYDGYQEVLQEVKLASTTIELLRPVLDTAAHRLEKINRGQNPDSLPTTPLHPGNK
jgi:hypothetical protein